MSHTPKFLWGRLNPEWTGPQPAVVIRGRYVMPSSDYQSYSPEERADDIVNLALSSPSNPCYLPAEELDNKISELVAERDRILQVKNSRYVTSHTSGERSFHVNRIKKEISELEKNKQDGQALRESLSDKEWDAALSRSCIDNALTTIRNYTANEPDNEADRVMHDCFLEIAEDLSVELEDLHDDYPGDPYADLQEAKVSRDAVETYFAFYDAEHRRSLDRGFQGQ